MDFQINNKGNTSNSNVNQQDRVNKLLQAKEKIISIINIRGPSLPVHITKETGLSMLLASALLSELLSEKKLKISNMRVGGSPLYFIPGQENLLEKFYNYLSGKEKEAFLVLKENSVLEDSNLHPAIRVALRSMRDFAKPMQFRTKEGEEKLYWRHFALTEQDAFSILNKLKTAEKIKEEKFKEVEKVEKVEEKPIEEKKIKIKKAKKEKHVIDIFDKGKVKRELEKELKPAIKIAKPKEKSVFVVRTMDFLNTKGIELLNDIDFRKKEYMAKVKTDSQLGKIELLCIAKEKKKITEDDLSSALHKGQSMKLPVIFVSNGELDKKAQAWLSEWKNLISFMRLE